MAVENKSAWRSRVAGSQGEITVSGLGSQWTNSGSLFVGRGGNGTLNILNGGSATSSLSRIGNDAGATGSVTVDGSGSSWNVGSDISVGSVCEGTLTIQNGGVVGNSNSFIGHNAGSTGLATVAGPGSSWTVSNELRVGDSGDGTLNILDGSVVTSAKGNLGRQLGSTGTVNVSGIGSQWNINSNTWLDVGLEGSGTLNVLDGGVVNGYLGMLNGFNGSASATVSGTGSQLNFQSELFVLSRGTLVVENGGEINNYIAWIGDGTPGVGSATVTGSGSRWNNDFGLIIGRLGGAARLDVTAGGVVNSGSALVGREVGSQTGLVTVTGAGSQWNNATGMTIGNEGKGTLNVESGGLVSTVSANVGRVGGSTGVVSVTGGGSQFVVTSGLNVGGNPLLAGGSGTVNILDNGLVSVSGITRIYSSSAVNLDGGRFEFGQTTLAEYLSINAVSGSLAGNVLHTGYSDVATLSDYESQGSATVDTLGVSIGNSGVLYGDGTVNLGLVNLAGGEVETIVGERMRFTGSNNSNAGEINNFGGQIRFDQSVLNQAGGLIGGRGQFIANGGWTNDGVMAFSGGPVEVLGNVVNNATGQIAIGGTAFVTFTMS